MSAETLIISISLATTTIWALLSLLLYTKIISPPRNPIFLALFFTINFFTGIMVSSAIQPGLASTVVSIIASTILLSIIYFFYQQCRNEISNSGPISLANAYKKLIGNFWKFFLISNLSVIILILGIGLAFTISKSTSALMKTLSTGLTGVVAALGIC